MHAKQRPGHEDNLYNRLTLLKPTIFSLLLNRSILAVSLRTLEDAQRFQQPLFSQLEKSGLTKKKRPTPKERDTHKKRLNLQCNSNWTLTALQSLQTTRGTKERWKEPYISGNAQREVKKDSYWIESSDLAKQDSDHALFAGLFFSGQNMKDFSSRAFPHCVRLQTPQIAHGLRHTFLKLELLCAFI
jgi:hypothetical protein